MYERAIISKCKWNILGDHRVCYYLYRTCEIGVIEELKFKFVVVCSDRFCLATVRRMLRVQCIFQTI